MPNHCFAVFSTYNDLSSCRMSIANSQCIQYSFITMESILLFQIMTLTMGQELALSKNAKEYASLKEYLILTTTLVNITENQQDMEKHIIIMSRLSRN